MENRGYEHANLKADLPDQSSAQELFASLEPFEAFLLMPLYSYPNIKNVSLHYLVLVGLHYY